MRSNVVRSMKTWVLVCSWGLPVLFHSGWSVGSHVGFGVCAKGFLWNPKAKTSSWGLLMGSTRSGVSFKKRLVSLHCKWTKEVFVEVLVSMAGPQHPGCPPRLCILTLIPDFSTHACPLCFCWRSGLRCHTGVLLCLSTPPLSIGLCEFHSYSMVLVAGRGAVWTSTGDVCESTF